MSALLCLLLLLSVAYYCESTLDYCQEYNLADELPLPTDPVFPDIPETYRARFQISDPIKKSTITVKQYVDLKNQLLSEKVWIDEFERRFVLYNGTNSVTYYVDFHAKDLHCDAYKSAPDFADFRGLLHVDQVSVPDIFFVLKNDTLKKYEGIETVGGVPTNKWSACFNRNTTLFSYSFKVQYFYTKPDWKNVYAHGNLKRIVIDGLFIESKATSVKPIQYKTTYDFFELRANITASNAFSMPVGVYCEGAIQNTSLPFVEDSFFFEYDSIEPATKLMFAGMVVYDRVDGLIRVDQTQTTNYRYYTTYRKYSVINDLNTGVVYTKNKDRSGECQVSPLWNNPNRSASIHFDIRDFFNASFTKGLFQYHGKRTVDGILHDVYVIKETSTTVLEYLYTSLPWLFIPDSTDRASKRYMKTVLSFIIRYDMDANIIKKIRLHDYSPITDTKWNQFNVEDCVKTDEQVDYVLEIVPDSFYGTTRNDLLKATRQAMVKAMNISIIRIEHDSMRKKYPKFFYQFTLLNSVKDHYLFHTDNKVVGAKSSTKVFNNIRRVDDCAHICLNQTDINCLSFDFCIGSKTCRLSIKSTMEGTELYPTIQCIHYTKNRAKLWHQPSQRAAYLTLRNLVYQKAFIIQDGSVTARGVRLHGVFNPTKTSQTSSLNDETAWRFNVQYNTIIHGFNDAKHVYISAEECAQNCLKSPSFRCESFEYCYTTKECYLSTKHPDSTNISPVKDQKWSQSECDLYSRKYIADFSQSRKTASNVRDMTYQVVKSADYCAQLCAKTDDFTCLSFQYCSQDQRCVLSKESKPNHPAATWNNSCDFYVQHKWKYFNWKKDFSVIANPSDAFAVLEFGYNDCIAACYDEGEKCLSAEVCWGDGGKTTCRLTHLHVYDGKTKGQYKYNCFYIPRVRYNDGTEVTQKSIELHDKLEKAKENVKVGKSFSTGQYTGGSMAGVAIGMILLTCLLFAGALYGYLKYRGKTLDSDFIVSLSKIQEDN